MTQHSNTSIWRSARPRQRIAVRSSANAILSRKAGADRTTRKPEPRLAQRYEPNRLVEVHRVLARASLTD